MDPIGPPSCATPAYQPPKIAHRGRLQPQARQGRRVGVHVDEVVEERAARTATSNETRDLQLRPGSQVFQVTRTMLANGKPVETCEIIRPTSRYLLSYRISVD